jgi:hypothetical protein
MPRRYRYIGPPEIRLRSKGKPVGVWIRSTDDVTKWVRESKQEPDAAGLFATTFVIDSEGRLLIADRHSEHVACAGGGEVLSAGELFFVIDGTQVLVEQISNQSTVLSRTGVLASRCPSAGPDRPAAPWRLHRRLRLPQVRRLRKQKHRQGRMVLL